MVEPWGAAEKMVAEVSVRPTRLTEEDNGTHQHQGSREAATLGVRLSGPCPALMEIRAAMVVSAVPEEVEALSLRYSVRP